MLELGELAAAALVVSVEAPVLEVLLEHLSEIIFTSVTCSDCWVPEVLLVPVLLVALAELLAVEGVPVTSIVCPTCGWSCESFPDN